ncbi:MAG: GNAT family N-acetyltransferase [Desulfobacteraceae bacterium]|nr:GNAT family N-acetyltransferase [Desulfobacteraceae bacterium]
MVLAKIDSEDTDSLYELTNDQKVMKFFPKILSYTETQQMIDKILNHYKKYGHCFWKVILKESYKFVGIAGLLHQEIDGNDETEISYRIISDYWNQGYATEAAQACREYANIINKDPLISIIHPENIASKRVAEKLGATKEKETTFLNTEHDVYKF